MPIMLYGQTFLKTTPVNEMITGMYAMKIPRPFIISFSVAMRFFPTLQKMEEEKLYKLPLYTIGNNVFINTDAVKLPEGIVFGNPWYKTNVHFEDWELK